MSGNIKCLILSLLTFSACFNPIFSQKHIPGGTINNYGHVTGIGTDYVNVANNTEFLQFHAGDTVLLIQMKGVRIWANEASQYGSSGFSYGEAGKHEFLRISLVDGISNKITFSNNIITSGFSLSGDLQIVKVPSYNYAVVDGTLTCAAWDSVSKTGGVLAAIFTRTLSLNGNIDVTGKGFKGGTPSNGFGICMVTDLAKWNRYKYSADYDSSAFKGEGLAILADPSGSNTPPYYPVYPLYAKGYGKNFNGGGGGNGAYSGGGGGSSYGAGGTGGRELNTCAAQPGGIGGISITGTGIDGGIFLGGGGGGSTYQTGTPVGGANGGGIVILITDTLKGNGKNILADGAAPSGTASSNAGAGGGGGGGSIALYLQSYTSIPATAALAISSKGGKGGNNAGLFGEGGGGGGGFIATNNISTPGNVTKSISGGAVGTRSGPSTGTAGTAGKSVTTFSPKLNGFLFNSIVSSQSGIAVDSICSNIIPKKISGTQPVGGTPGYTYAWLKGSSATGPWSEIVGANTKDYTFTAPEATTIWIRRYVTDSSLPTAIKDTSKAVKIVVQPAITGNVIKNDTTICFGQDPLLLVHSGTPAGGYGNMHYHWLQNTDNIWTSYVSAVGTDSTKADFNPAALNLTTYYKRKINAGRCVDFSNTVKVTVLPSITNNILNSHDTIICEGFPFDSLKAKKPLGGSSAFLYQWQDRNPSTSWADIALATKRSYFPDTSKFNDTDTARYYRRVVYSGLNNTCTDAGPQVKLTRFPKISNNKITSPDTTICSGKTPNVRRGTALSGGNGIAQWTWQQSADAGSSWANATSTYTNQNYSPPPLIITTWYRRNVKSSVCLSTSNITKVNSDPVITNFTIAPDTTICSSTAVFKIRGKSPGGGTGTYGFTWKKSNDNSIFPFISGAIQKDYTPAISHTQPTWYRRIVSSGACKDSSQVKVDVLASIGGNIIAADKPEVCYNIIPGTLVQTGAGLSGGSGSYVYLWQDSITGGTWFNSNGVNTNSTYSPVNQLTKTKWFRRKVISGPAACCYNISAPVAIDTLTLPTGSITAVADTTICNGNQVLLKVHLTGAGPWIVNYNENTTGVPVTGIATPKYTISRTPSVTAATSIFNYSLASVQDKYGCLATSMTGAKKATVYRVPVANAGPDDAVCGPVYTLAAVPSDGTGSWQFPPQVLASVPGNPHSLIKIDSSFTGANVSYTFYWEETNGICKNKDEVIIRFDYRIDSVSAGKGASIMSFDNITLVDGSTLKSFESGLWTVVAGSGDFEDATSNSTYVKNIALGINTFKWTVTNGKCVVASLVSFDVSSPVIPEGITPDGDLINDSLKVEGLDFVNQEIDLTILNGAGSKVFSTTNRNGNSWQVWDGKSDKGLELPEGTYYYLLKVYSFKTQHVSQKSGFIILKRR